MLRPVNASEVGAAVVSAAVVTSSGPLVPAVPLAPTDAPVPPAEALVETPTDPPPPAPTVFDRAAPAAGLAIRISGTAQATAPAVATADMRPMTWRSDAPPAGAVPVTSTTR